jgi:acetyltransferase-like isoleucine patch superfamily enzyme
MGEIMNLSYLISKLIKKLHIPAITNSNIDKTSRVCSGSHLVSTTIGKYSYIGNFCTVINTQIGSFCSIADNCIIGGASHPIEWVSTSPVFHEGKNIMNKNFSTHGYKTGEITEIGNDVWIGNNCLIKSGVKIGNGSVIGMGSVLTKDVGDYEIWAGNPARLIRKRFNDEKIEQLKMSKWWDWENKELYKFAVNFNNIEEFLKSIKGES